MPSPPDQQLYWIWGAIIQRCTNPKNRQFKDYGGRGITVCDRWKAFANFAADMGPRPPGRLLDRRDNNKGYGPDNCQWVTRQEQNSNRRNCIMVDCDGEQVTLREYCRRRGLKYRPIVKRIQTRNWPVAMALSVPLSSGKHFKRNPTKEIAA